MIVIEIHLPLSAVANASGSYHFVLLGYCELMNRIGDYRTIDWVHDSVKEQFRKKALRSMTGFRGFIVNMFDSMEGWIIVGIIGTPLTDRLRTYCSGFITALIAYCIDVSESVLFDWKQGYCTTNWRLDENFCCWKIERCS